jgi:hypothetical protein
MIYVITRRLSGSGDDGVKKETPDCRFADGVFHRPLPLLMRIGQTVQPYR